MALVAAWNFNEGSGTTAADSSGNGYTLTATGSPWAASGKTSSGATSGGQNVLFSRSTTWGALTAWTISFWIRCTANGNWQTCILFATGGSPWFLEVNSTNQIGLYPGAGATIGENSSTALATNTWTHFAITRSGSTVTIYLNGVSVVTSSNALNLPGSVDMRVCAAGAAANEFLTTSGAMDDLRIYDHAQTAGEISTDMSTPVGGSSPTYSFPFRRNPSRGLIMRGRR